MVLGLYLFDDPVHYSITIDYKSALPILDILYSDNTRFVTRSVANHLNDISKADPILVIKTLKRWEKSGNQADNEMEFIVRHSLRTLEKQGNKSALQLLGYSSGKVDLHNLHLLTPQVVIGEALEFSFSIVSHAKKDQNVLVDYHLYFQKASGQLAPKTFKIAKVRLKPGETRHFTKKQLLRPMTTRVLHPGRHVIELQINGVTFQPMEFTLLDVE